jgi:hypothetical protein
LPQANLFAKVALLHIADDIFTQQKETTQPFTALINLSQTNFQAAALHQSRSSTTRTSSYTPVSQSLITISQTSTTPPLSLEILGSNVFSMQVVQNQLTPSQRNLPN